MCVQGVTVEKRDPDFPGVDPRRVDKVSRWLFPSLFILFTTAYCTVYGLLSNYQASLQQYR